MSEALGRLTRRREFLVVARSRRRWATPGLVLQARRRGRDGEEASVETGRARVGFTASRKVGTAVARNRARRRLRAAVRRVMPAHAAPEYDFVVIARTGTLTRPFSSLISDLEEALRRVGAYRGDDRSPAARGSVRPSEPGP